MNRERLGWGKDLTKWWIVQIPGSRRRGTPARTCVYAPEELDGDPVQFPTLREAIEAFSRGGAVSQDQPVQINKEET